MSTVLLAGGGGYLGTILAEHFLQTGRAVRVFDRFFFGRDLFARLLGNPRLELVTGDVRWFEPEVLSGVEAVINLAAISNDPACDLDPAVTEAINFEGALQVARAARQAGVRRYVFSSSCSVYGAADDQKIDEDSELHPVSLYAKTKVRAEKELLALSDDRFGVTVLRTATTYGLSPRMRFDLMVNLMTLTAFKSRKIFVLGGGRQWRPLIHVRDVALAFDVMLQSPFDRVAGRTFNIGSSEQNFQVRTLANLVQGILPSVEVEIVPDDPDKRSYRVSFDRVRDELGFRPQHTVLEGVAEIHEALRNGLDDDVRTRTVGFYKNLLEAERLIRELSFRGRIF